jgi:hypothetical protein
MQVDALVCLPCRNPSNELQPGPPLSQMTISFVALRFAEGKNQKNSSEAFFALEMGNKPA